MLTDNSQLADIVFIGIDPGTTYLGLAVMKVNPYTDQFQSFQATTLVAGKLPTYNKLISKVHNDLTARVYAYCDILTELFTVINPSFIGSESAFFNPRNPAAHAALVEAIAVIRRAVHNYNPLMPLDTYPPSIVKNNVGCKGNVDKSVMLQRMLELNIPVTEFDYCGIHDNRRLEEFDEHSIDACAVCLSLYRQHIRQEYTGELK